MLSDFFVLLSIPLSVGISGIIFLLIAFFLRRRYSYHGGVQTTGILTGFWESSLGYVVAEKDGIFGQQIYPVYDYNKTDSKPVFRFQVNGRTVELHSEWSVADLGRKDIGRELLIRYFTQKDGRAYRVILEGKQYESQRDTGRKIIFWVFAGIGILLCVLAGITVFLFF